MGCVYLALIEMTLLNVEMTKIHDMASTPCGSKICVDPVAEKLMNLRDKAVDHDA